MSAITTSLRVIKPLQHIEEVTRGTTPTDATFVFSAPVTDFSPNVNVNNAIYRKLGSPDFAKSSLTGNFFQFDISYQPIDRILLSKGINLDTEDATHNREQSLSFVLSQQMDNAGALAEYYIVPKGCSCDSTTIDVSHEAVAVSQTWIANDIPLPNTDPNHASLALGAAPTFATDPGTACWTGITSGSSPLTHNAINSYVPRAFSVTVSHNTDQIQALGSTGILATIPTTRDISGSFDILHDDASFGLQTDLENHTPRAMTYNLSTDTKLTFTDVYLTDMSESISATSTEAKMQSWSFVAKSVVCEAI